MKIDTSTTAGKIQVMQAFVDGKTVQNKVGSAWYDVSENCTWLWDFPYRMKPQTVEEAANMASDNYGFHENKTHLNFKHGFIQGADWQKEQDNE